MDKEEYKLFITNKYKENDDIKQDDKFCPLIKEVCLGSACAFWINDSYGCKQK